MIEIIDTIPSFKKTLHKKDINDKNTRIHPGIIDRKSETAAQEGDEIKLCSNLGKSALISYIDKSE